MDLIRWPVPRTPCQLGYHSWDLKLPIVDPPYARCSTCGRRATPEEAQLNMQWQAKQMEERRAARS